MTRQATQPLAAAGERLSKALPGVPAFTRSLTRSLSPGHLSPVSQRTHRRGKNCSAEFKQRHEVIRAQLRTHGVGVINPRTTKWVAYWDMMTFVCLIFTAAITPIEVCLFVDTSPASGPQMLALFICNRVVDIIFGVDLILNFFMAYQQDAQGGGLWVTKLPQIRSHYLRTWFAVDVMSMLPFELLTQAGLIGESDNYSSLLRLVRTIRLLRLIKLLRLLRASRILARWKSYFGLSYATTTMMKFFTMTIFMVHLMGCAWAWMGVNWSPTEGATLPWEMSWLDKYGFREADGTTVATNRLYIISLYVAVVAMFGGVSQLYPANFAEYVLYLFMMLFGSMVWAWVIGSLCGILATMNPQATAFQNTMDELEYFMRERNFAQQHRVRLRDFFRQTQDYSRLASYNNLMVKMSVQLRGDTALKIGMSTLQQVWYFSLDCVEKEFLAVVALNLYGAVYEAREVLPTVDLTVIMKGMAARKLKLFTKGATLGTDCVIPYERQNLRELDTANCLTFVQTSQISRQSLMTIVEHFPVAKAHVRKAAAIYTLKAAFRQYFKAYKDMEVRTMSGDGDLNSFCAGKREGTRSFAGKSQIRQKIAQKKTHQGINFQDILASVERAKNGPGFDKPGGQSDVEAYREKQRQLRVPGVGVEEEMMPALLTRGLNDVKKAQELEAKRAQDLIARNEVLEIRCGALDDKLGLILNLVTSMRNEQRNGGGTPKSVPNGSMPRRPPGSLPGSADKSFNGSPAGCDPSPNSAGGPSTGGLGNNQVLHRRRKPNKGLAKAALAVRVGQRPSGNLLGALAASAAAHQNGAVTNSTQYSREGPPRENAVAAALAQQAAIAGAPAVAGAPSIEQLVARAAERAELRDALEA